MAGEQAAAADEADEDEEGEDEGKKKKKKKKKRRGKGGGAAAGVEVSLIPTLFPDGYYNVKQDDPEGGYKERAPEDQVCV